MDSFYDGGDEFTTHALHRTGERYFPGDKVKAAVHGNIQYHRGIIKRRPVQYNKSVLEALHSGNYVLEVLPVDGGRTQYATVRGGCFVSVSEQPYGGSAVVSYDGSSVSYW